MVSAQHFINEAPDELVIGEGIHKKVSVFASKDELWLIPLCAQLNERIVKSFKNNISRCKIAKDFS